MESKEPHGKEGRPAGGDVAGEVYHRREDFVSRPSPSIRITVPLAMTVAGSLLALGAVHTIPLFVFAGTGALSAWMALRHGRLPSRRSWLSPFTIFALLAAFTCLQALPLPLGWLAVISPKAAEVWAESLSPFGHAPRLASISLDPGASIREALKWLTYAHIFFAAAALARLRGAAPLAVIVFGSAVLAALVSLGHGLLGATSVYGVYEPRFRIQPWHIGPLLNPNNLAGYLNLGIFSGLGLWLKTRRNSRLPRWLVPLGLASLIAVTITTASRAGLISLSLGLVAFASLVRRFDKVRTSRSRIIERGALLAGIGGGVVLAWLGATDAIWRELFSRDLEKLGMSLWIAPILEDFAWLGMGRGSFESVFPAYRPSGGHIVFTHIESFPAQWIAEWGLPVALLALAALAWALSPRKLLKRRSPLSFSIAIGLGVLLLQNLADLGLEIPAIAIAAALLLGALTGRSQASRSLSPAPARAKRLHQAMILLAPAILAALLLASGWRDVASDRERVQALVEGAEARGFDTAQEAIAAAIRRHPADPYFPLMGAVLSRRMGEDPLPWLSRSLERALVNPRAHLLLADILFSLGQRGQALLELRLALEQEPALLGPGAAMAIRMTRDFDTLARFAEQLPDGALVLEEMAVRLPWESRYRCASPPCKISEAAELGFRLHEEALARDPERVRSHIALADELIAALDHHLRSSDGESPPPPIPAFWHERLSTHIDAVLRARPRSFDAVRLQAERIRFLGSAEEAESFLSRECPSLADRAIPCLRLRVRMAALSESHHELFPPAAKAFLSRACVKSGPECAAAAGFLGDIASGKGEGASALGYYLRAAREEPTEERWRKAASSAEETGAHSQAVEALERIARIRGGADEALQNEIDALRLRGLAR